jgi:hypothetical protein
MPSHHLAEKGDITLFMSKPALYLLVYQRAEFGYLFSIVAAPTFGRNDCSKSTCRGDPYQQGLAGKVASAARL